MATYEEPQEINNGQPWELDTRNPDCTTKQTSGNWKTEVTVTNTKTGASREFSWHCGDHPNAPDCGSNCANLLCKHSRNPGAV